LKKKKAPNPSGPGALSLFRPKTAALISKAEGSIVRTVFI